MYNFFDFADDFVRNVTKKLFKVKIKIFLNIKNIKKNFH